MRRGNTPRPRQAHLRAAAVRSQRPAGTATAEGTVLFLSSPKIVIEKARRRLLLYDGDKLVREYGIGLGSTPVGHKRTEGDGKTPEGHYYVCTKNPCSRFNISLGLSYPNSSDAAAGLAEGRIAKSEHDDIIQATDEGGIPPWKTALGGEIFIHGNGSKTDWTSGCIALDDGDIEEFYDSITVGTRVGILP